MTQGPLKYGLITDNSGPIADWWKKPVLPGNADPGIMSRTV